MEHCKPQIILLIITLLATAVFPALAEQPANNTPLVIVAPVTQREISDNIEALGTAHATESVNITASVSDKITKIHFEDGQYVKAGDILVELDHAEQLANLKQAQAVHGERKLALERLLKLEERQTQLTAPDEIDRARLELEQAEAGISAIRTGINDRQIRAPFDGIVGLRDISVGALVETGDLIITLDDTRQIKLDFTVPSIFLTELKPGLAIRARSAALGEREYKGVIKSVNSRIDPVTRSIKVRSLLPNADSSILPGLLMQVDLLRNTRQALLIPEAALLPLAEKQYVMVRVQHNENDTVEKREVVIGSRLPGYVEILKGLDAGEQVVTHGNNKIKAGDNIKILAVDDGSVDISTLLKKRKLEDKTP